MKKTNRQRNSDLYISYPCRHAGQWCSCWKGPNGSGRICKHKGNYIKGSNFSGIEPTNTDLGTGPKIIIGGIILYMLFTIE